MKFRTRAIHVGNERDPGTGAVVRPIHMASTYVQPSAGEWGDYDYSRSGNPTRDAFEITLASLENGTQALAFATGMAATHAVTMILQTGDHIVTGQDIYGGTYRLFHKIASRAGISVTMVNLADTDAVAAALTPQTKLLWLESPGNPLLSIADISKLTQIAHQQPDCLVGVDNTFATPVITRPLDLGVDIVMHSVTKYIGGHSDLMGGALVVKNQELYDRLYYVQNATGAVLGPLECFLASRGLKTLDIRVREQSKSAQMLADFLNDHPKVEKVFYPGLPSHPGHDIAKRQMKGAFGPMLSFQTVGDFASSQRAVNSTKLFQLAVSLGAVESLIEQPASMSHASYDAADRQKHGIADSLIRLSVGLEDVDDLKSDLDQALSQV